MRQQSIPLKTLCPNFYFIVTTDGLITSIALDWMTGNLYGVTHRGYLFVCKLTSGAVTSLKCKTLLPGEQMFQVIAVNPNTGYGLHNCKLDCT